jgi:predicted Zn-dependent peptidase
MCGVSHFLEHLLFKGTATRSARDIATSVDRVGGDMNAFTSKEFTAYFCRVPATNLELALDLLGDVLTVPALRAADIESERQVILEELAMDEDTPDDTAYRLFASALFPGHPLGRETAGDPSTVSAITPDDVRRFFSDHYRTGSMVLAVAGPVDHDELVAVARDRFAAAPVGTAAVRRTAPDAPTMAIAGEERDCEQVHILIGGRSLARRDPDREALDIVSHVLGGGPSSRLFQSIREERGLAYATDAGSSVYADAGLFAAYAATGVEHAAEVVGLMDGELASIVEHGITEDELEIAKGYLTGAFAMAFEGTASRAERLGSALTTYGSIRSIEEQLARWQGVTMDDTRRAIERVLANVSVRCAVGPVEPEALLRG